MKTIADYDHGRENNYHLIRLIAASLVIVAHSYYLSTSGESEPLRALIGYKHFGEVGVQIFFVISGFLVTKSFLSRRDTDLVGYLEARVLRIFPALVVAVTFTVFVMGALATTVPLNDYFTHERTFSYLFNNATLYREVHDLPGVFAANPYPNAVNGSLWSLFTEIRLYLLVAVLGVFGLLAQRVFNNALILCLLLYIYFPGLFQLLRLILSPLFVDIRVSGYFALGAFCYINRKVVPIHWLIAVALSAVALFLHGTSYFPIVFDLAVSY